MASLINISLGFNYNKGVMNTVVGDVGNFTSVCIGASKAVSDLKNKANLLKDIQGFAAVGNLVNNTIGAVGSLYKEIKGAFTFVDDYASKGDKIAKTSRLVGLSVKEYQAFGSAAQHAGMEVSEMEKSFTRLNVNFQKAKSGDANALEMFNAILGDRSVNDFSSKTELLSAIADGYTRLESAEQKTFVSQELFGKSGVKIAELFKDGGESLKEYVTNYKAAFDDKSASSAEEFKDSLQDVTESFEGMKAAIAIDLFPIFKELFFSVKKFFESKDGEKLKKSISEIADVIVCFVRDNLPKIPKILDSIVGFIDIIGPGFSAFGVAVVALLPFLSSIVAGLMGLASVVSGPVLLGIGLVVAAVALWGGVVMKVRDNWDMLKSFIVDDVWGAIKGFFSDCVDAVNDWIEMFVEDVKWLWNGFKSIFIDPFLNFFKALPDAFSNLWDGFKNGVSQIGNFIYNTFFGAISGAINAAKGLLSSLPLVGGLFASDGAAPVGAAPSNVAAAVQQSYTTTTSRFAVDFNNVPRGATITPPAQGDFDWSRSYTLAGGV